MTTIVLVSKIALCVFSVIIIALVLMQKSKEGVSGSALGQTGGSSYLDRMKGQTSEGRLKLLTKIFTGLFVAVLIALMFLQ